MVKLTERQLKIRTLEQELAGLGYHVVLAIEVDTVRERLGDRVQDKLADGHTLEQIHEPAWVESFEALNHIAMQTAFALSENHLDMLGVDDALDEAIETYTEEHRP